LLLLQRPPLVDHSELTRFHSNDYISFLRTISPDNMHDHLRELQRCECRRCCCCCLCFLTRCGVLVAMLL
jgi:acetoin utilization deacetylase AcuC-like enzyme